jgi:hypothetical protein
MILHNSFHHKIEEQIEEMEEEEILSSRNIKWKKKTN